MRCNFVSLLTLIVILVWCAPIRADEVDDYIRAQMQKRQVPGLSIAIIQDGKIIKAQGYGVIEKGRKTPVTTSTLFLAGSISKPVAAVGALHLVEQGKLSLDEDVNAKLTSWKVPENEFTRDQKVTLRRILSHTAGLTVHGFIGYAIDAPRPTLLQILDGEKAANTPAIRVETVPGSKWNYSGGGYTIMQQLILDVTGKSFPEYMQEAVLGPLGMTHSTYQQPLPANKVSFTAAGTYEDGSVVKGRWLIYPQMAAAGLWTTPSDLARFAIGVRQAFAGKPGSVLSQETARQMLTVQPPSADGGLGVGLDSKELDSKTLRFSHSGRDDGFDACLLAYASTGQGVVIMMNANENSGIYRRIMRVIAQHYHWPDYPKPLAPKQPVIHVDTKALAACTGYYDYQSAPLSVTVTKGKLIGKIGSGLYDEFLPETNTTFFLPDQGNEVSFDRNAAGDVIGITWNTPDGHTLRLPRIGETARLRKAQPDPNATRTAHVGTFLEAFGAGGTGITAAAYLTPGAQQDLRNGDPSLAGLQSLTYIGEDDVADRDLTRHGGKVARVLIYSFTKAGATHYVLIYMTAQGLFTDLDVVED
jgi:CubicO group peptidase (beta-lactamase class C family)